VDGATVVVPGIVVLGTIEPKDAVVLVSGKRATVHNGAFKWPLVLRHRVTRIKVIARARGFVASTTELAVTYRPDHRRSPHAVRAGAVQSSPASASLVPLGGGADGTLPSGPGAAFVAGCTNSGGSVIGCTCVWSELTKRGFDTEPQLEALAEQWRRSFLSKGVIAFPPALRNAVLSCAGDFGPRMASVR
jgi:hypothetical protein